MEKQGKWAAPFLVGMMPLIPLAYLYARNADYLSAGQVAAVGGAMVLVSLIGYGLFRAVFRARFAALMGCLTGWVFFFAMRGASNLPVFQLDRVGFDGFLLRYGALALVGTLIVPLITRRLRGGQLYPILLIFFSVLLAYNGFIAVKTGVSMEFHAMAADKVVYKTRFEAAQNAPSPNVYWIHCDAMLGFDAFETYFGDDQAEFAQGLAERGFSINRGAMLEAFHQTRYAVPALMCPSFYDSLLQPVLKDHETAMAQAPLLSLDALDTARLKNETRLAFEQKGYLSQTFGSISIYYPPVSDRVYSTGDTSAFLLETDERFKEKYLSVLEAGELTTLMTGMPNGTYLNLVMKLSARGLLPFEMKRSALQHDLTDGEIAALSGGKKLQRKTDMMLGAINDSTYADQPTFDIVFYLGAHSPFVLDENGDPNPGDHYAVASYAPQHRYAADMLIIMIDEILERDPDAVIVLQADHGLHQNTAAEITQAFGEDAVEPLWNQVLSALRVPEKYQTGEERHALENPLNMSRYLVNTFVGKNYDYVQ